MPRKDPVARKAYQKQWLKGRLDDGYGKRLYARRKLHREHALHFKAMLEEVLEVCTHKHMYDEEKVVQIAHSVKQVLAAAESEEEKLKR